MARNVNGDHRRRHLYAVESQWVSISAPDMDENENDPREKRCCLDEKISHVQNDPGCCCCIFGDNCNRSIFVHWGYGYLPISYKGAAAYISNIERQPTFLEWEEIYQNDTTSRIRATCDEPWSFPQRPSGHRPRRSLKVAANLASSLL